MKRKRNELRVPAALAACFLALALPGANPEGPQARQPVPKGATASDLSSPREDLTLVDRPRPNHGKLTPGPDDYKIARLVAGILRQAHYSQIPFDDALSAKFLDRYLDALDPAHMLFIQDDLDDFDRWRNTLDDLTLRLGDTSPADAIFNRFLERYEQQLEFATNLLATEKLSFTGTDRYLINRKEQPRPRSLEEARQLWRERTRYEYLIEKLNMVRQIGRAHV
jgi:carboxyl-terminal processing protease